MTTATGEKLHFGEDYKSKFSSECYLRDMYTEKTLEEDPLVQLLINKLHEVFDKVPFQPDGQLLDFGCGPSIYGSLSASRKFGHITAAEYSPSNRRQVEMWLANTTGCHDWSPFFKHVAKLEGLDDWQLIPERLRRRVNHVVLPCDVMAEDPMLGADVGPVDALVTSLVLDAACQNSAEYQVAVEHLADLIKPGGLIVNTGVINGSFYRVNNLPFHNLSQSKEQIEMAFTQAGFEDITFYTGTDLSVVLTDFDAEEAFVLSARKRV